MTYHLIEDAEIRRLKISRSISQDQKARFGQFFTPASVAKVLASQFHKIEGDIKLVDPGAGIGILTAAFVERVIQNPSSVSSCHITAYEIEPSFQVELEQTLIDCCEVLSKYNITSDYSLIQKDFLKAETESINYPLFSSSENYYTHAIENPPYKKIQSQSSERKILSLVGIETVNLYSAFIWLTTLRLVEQGELVAITPRSFFNGTYYRPFRLSFLQRMALDTIYVFESRETAFSDDNVLQENVIFHAIKNNNKPDAVLIISGNGIDLGETSIERKVPYEEVIRPEDPEKFIHITIDDTGDAVKNQMEAFPASLDDLGIQVSTGPVVDFRMKQFLRKDEESDTVPLIYPEAIRDFRVSWPPHKIRKPIAIINNFITKKWLTKSGWYVLTKRFSAKEEKRRVVAAYLPPLKSTYFGIENHLNFFHSSGNGIDKDLAKGLALFLNSTLFDNYFRQFSGHTQINATDLRKIRYPLKINLVKLGERIGDETLTQDIIDNLISEVLPLMETTIDALQINQRIKEALSILKELSVPRGQQNERSALCLLALGDIKPETKWHDVQRPYRRITEMMDWFKANYGKAYAPNSRETVRRQTIHQFIQLGLVVENPDEQGRPINSPNWCYQLSEAAFILIRAYGTIHWEKAKETYCNSVINQLSIRHRDLPTIPVRLPDGSQIELTVGGQNELIRDIIENFCPRYTPNGIILCVGDAGAKFIINEIEMMESMGIKIDPHGKMPDVVIFHEKEDWLFLIEAVTSHGPVDLKRRNELKALFSPSGKGLVYVTAFPTSEIMTEYLSQISWETEVWLSSEPDHMIHFNGEKFLGPYND